MGRLLISADRQGLQDIFKGILSREGGLYTGNTPSISNRHPLFPRNVYVIISKCIDSIQTEKSNHGNLWVCVGQYRERRNHDSYLVSPTQTGNTTF